MQFIGLSPLEFFSSLKEANKNSSYLFYNEKNGKLKIKVNKNALKTFNSSAYCLDFNTIIKIAYRFHKVQQITPKEAPSFLHLFAHMHAKKQVKDESKFFILKIIHHYLECFKNKLDGFGFYSSSQIYQALNKELTSIGNQNSNFASSANLKTTFTSETKDSAPLAKPLPSLACNERKNKKPYSKTVRIKGTSSLQERTRSYLETAQSTGDLHQLKKPVFVAKPLTSRVDQYANDDEPCSEQTKIALFKSIEVKFPAHSSFSLAQQPKNIPQLLAYLSLSPKIDLTHPKCMQAITDLFLLKPIFDHEKILSWLKEQPSFHSELINKIFMTLHDRNMQCQPVDFADVHKLFDFYIKKIEQEKLIIEHYPFSPGLVTAMSLMIQLRLNDDITIKWMEWFCSHQELDIKSFKKWMQLFMTAKDPLSYIPARDLLIAKFQSIPFGWQKLKEEKEDALIAYLNKILAQCSR